MCHILTVLLQETLKWKGCQDDSPGIHWSRWEASTSPANITAVTLVTFHFSEMVAVLPQSKYNILRHIGTWASLVDVIQEPISAWISNYIHHKVWNEITYPFTNLLPLKFENGLVISSHTLLGMLLLIHTSMVSCQKGPTRHAYTWQIGPFWQDTLDLGYHSTRSIAWLLMQQTPMCWQVISIPGSVG